jgi:sugar phosphate isomerase/epimerase
MPRISRREFGTIVIAGTPLFAARTTRLHASGGLTLGVTMSSFRELPRVTGEGNVDDVIRALTAVRARHIELALSNVEPAPPSVAPFMGGTPAYPRVIVLTPEEIAATNRHARAALRTWRLETGTSGFDEIRAKLAAANLRVHACAVAYNDAFTDDEIDVTFRQVTALGIGTVSSPLTMAMAERLVPFAERHRVSVAVHNQDERNGDGLIGMRDARQVLKLSPKFTLKFDAGSVTASDGDPVAELGELYARVSQVVLRDRLRSGGRSQPFGEGDTPIRGVMRALRTLAPTIPVFVEYDYIGLRAAVDEVAASLQYLEAAG